MVADAVLSACIAYVTMHTIIAHFFGLLTYFLPRDVILALSLCICLPVRLPIRITNRHCLETTGRPELGFFGNQKPHVSRNFLYTLPATVVRSFRDGNNAMHRLHVFPVLWIASCFLTIYVTTYNTHYKIISQKFLTCSPRLFHFSSYTTTATCTSGSILPC